jgi:hypothetical protein
MKAAHASDGSMGMEPEAHINSDVSNQESAANLALTLNDANIHFLPPGGCLEAVVGVEDQLRNSHHRGCPLQANRYLRLEVAAVGMMGKAAMVYGSSCVASGHFSAMRGSGRRRCCVQQCSEGGVG